MSTAWRVGDGGWYGGAREPRAEKVVRARGVMVERVNWVFGLSSNKLFCLSLSLPGSSDSFVSCAWTEPFQFNVGPPLSRSPRRLFKTDFSEENPLILYVHQYASRSEESARARLVFVDDFCSSLSESTACSTFLIQPQTTENNGGDGT